MVRIPPNAGLQVPAAPAQPQMQADRLIDDCVRFRSEAAAFLKSVLPNMRFETVDAFTKDPELGLFTGSKVTGADRPRPRPSAPAPSAPSGDAGAPLAATGENRRKAWREVMEGDGNALEGWMMRKNDPQKVFDRADAYNERVGDVIEDHIFDGLQKSNATRAENNWDRDQFRKTEYRLEDESHFDRKLDEASDSRRAEADADYRRDMEMRRMESDMETRARRNRDRERY